MVGTAWLGGGRVTAGLFIFGILVGVCANADDQALEKLVDRLPPLFPEEVSSAQLSVSEWEALREAWASTLQYFEYGHMPPKPDRVWATETVERELPLGGISEQRMTLLIGTYTRLPMRVALYLPPGEGPFSILIREEHALGHIEEVPSVLERGYGFLEYAREDLDPDRPNVIGPAQAAYPEYDWATLAVWAWGGMRVVDYLETRDDIRMDQLGIIGHSRGGKMALLAGALDDRFGLVVANGSGAGGAGSYVVEDGKCESLEMITRPSRFGYWFHGRLRWFVDRRESLPFDQHFLKALVAPRALLCTEAREDLWANPRGTLVSSLAANKAFERFGVSERNGLHFRDGRHDLRAEDWNAILDFADWHFRGIKPDSSDRFRPGFASAE